MPRTKARRLRPRDTLIHNGHPFFIIRRRRRWPWSRAVVLGGVYLPSAAPATYVLAAREQVEYEPATT